MTLRAKRLRVESGQLYVISETSLSDMLGTVAEDKPDVLRRWIDMNEPNTKTLAMLSAITKFTIALQLALFTVVSSFFL